MLSPLQRRLEPLRTRSGTPGQKVVSKRLEAILGGNGGTSWLDSLPCGVLGLDGCSLIPEWATVSTPRRQPPRPNRSHESAAVHSPVVGKSVVDRRALGS